MMATVPHVTSGLGLRKFQAEGFLLTRMYMSLLCISFHCEATNIYKPSPSAPGVDGNMQRCKSKACKMKMFYGN